MRKRLSIPLILAAALLIYAVQGPSPQLITGPEPVINDIPTPESYARGVTVREFSATGEALDRTEAKELRRFKESALIEMDGALAKSAFNREKLIPAKNSDFETIVKVATDLGFLR